VAYVSRFMLQTASLQKAKQGGPAHTAARPFPKTRFLIQARLTTAAPDFTLTGLATDKDN